MSCISNKILMNVVKCAGLVPMAVCMPVFAQVHTENITVPQDEKITIVGPDEVYSGSLTGQGTVQVLPGFQQSTYVVWSGDVSGFSGAFQMAEYGYTGLPNATSTLVLKNWGDNQTFTMLTSGDGVSGNSGTYIFDGIGNVKVNAVQHTTNGGVGIIYLNGNTLDKQSVVDYIVYTGGKGVDVLNSDVYLSGYNTGTSGAVIYAGGSNNKVAGDVNTVIEQSSFKQIFGNGANTDVIGDVNLVVNDVTAESVFGNMVSADAFVTGDINVLVDKSVVSDDVLGITSWAKASTDIDVMGLDGTVTVNVSNSEIGSSIRGANVSGGTNVAWNTEKFKINDIVINVENTVVGQEIIGMGSNMSARGDITINLKGANAIGYQDLAAKVVSDFDPDDITVRVGAKRKDSFVAGNTTLNIDTFGSNKVNVNGTLNPGNEANAGDVQGNATLNIFNTADGLGFVNANTIETFNVIGDASINIGRVAVNVADTVSGFDLINIGAGGTLITNNLEMNPESKISITILDSKSYGKLNVTDTVSGIDTGNLELVIASVGEYKNVLGGINMNDFKNVYTGNVFDVSQQDNNIIVKTKSIDALAQSTGLSVQAAGVINGLANSADKNIQQISLMAQQALIDGNISEVEAETEKLNPDSSVATQSTTMVINNQVMSLVSGRMSGGISVVGRSGGDMIDQTNGFWAQGLFNKSKSTNKFDGYTRGFALGADTVINNVYTVGAGFAYNNTDVDSVSRHTDIDSKTLFLYGQYKPNKWFANATLAYTLSDYTENVDPFGVVIENTYDANVYAVQAMTGYDFATGITPEMGLRYMHVTQDDYSNGINTIATHNTDFLTAVAGLKYAFYIENDNMLRFRPEMRAALTYDMISDDAKTTVMLPSVGSSYQFSGENLSRFGGEFAVGLTAEYKGMEFSLMYDLDLHKDYTSQTGMIKFRSAF